MSAFHTNALGLCSFGLALGLGVLIGGVIWERDESAGQAGPEPVGVPTMPSGQASASPASKARRLVRTGSSREHVRYLLRCMPADEIPSVAAEILKRYREKKSSYQVGSLLEIWGERDPGAALRWYETEMPTELDERTRQQFFLGWGRADGAAALAYASEHSVGKWLKSFEKAALTGMAQTDPDGVGEQLAKVDDKNHELFREVLFQIGRSDPVAAYALLDSRPDAEGWARSFAMAAIFYGARDPEGLKQRVDQEFRAALAKPDAADPRLFGLSSTMAEFAPSLYIDSVLAADPSTLPEKIGSLSKAWRRMGSERRASTLAALLSHPSLSNEALSILTENRDASLRPELIAVVDGLSGDLKGQAQVAFAQGLAKAPRGALEYAQTIEGDASRDAALIAVAEVWAKDQPSEATAWAVEQSLESGLTEVVAITAEQWAYKDLTEATRWLDTLGEGQPHREIALRGAALGVFNYARRARGDAQMERVHALQTIFATLPGDAARSEFREAILQDQQAEDVGELIDANNWAPSAEEALRELFTES